jgi:hypothetical protein
MVSHAGTLSKSSLTSVGCGISSRADATGDKNGGNGKLVHTMWSWLGWQIGGKAYKVVRKHDTDRVSPAGDDSF